jgi:hypothetical protein
MATVDQMIRPSVIDVPSAILQLGQVPLQLLHTKDLATDMPNHDYAFLTDSTTIMPPLLTTASATNCITMHNNPSNSCGNVQQLMEDMLAVLLHLYEQSETQHSIESAGAAVSLTPQRSQQVVGFLAVCIVLLYLFEHF